ncbi:hypothetical protein [Alteromonas sp. W364]|uniref:hypothetical protein n=1 Tax=Alteromonas sp. W364 TaxID=3075610 RepID=UPI002887631B|nr:hypothetical protein [Alteromonas sp. W364]MDT0627496.1 hypothetical protein [Alteromonas sp. W364]
MKQNMILKDQVQYADVIDKALHLCRIMLSRSETLYPFAVISIDKDIQCTFLEDEDCQNTHPNGAHFGMIEKLERQIAIQKIQAKSAVSLLVYAATLKTPDARETDGLMFSLSDSNGENILTLYPYEFEINSIKLGKPFTCDFSD